MVAPRPIIAFTVVYLLAGASSRAFAQDGMAGMDHSKHRMGPEIVIPKGALYTKADVEFMQGMIAHHAQAIAMARLAPSHGAGQAVLTLTGRIINAQNDEIRLMQQWLRDRLQPVPEAKPGPMRMKMDGMEHEMLMPGMLTEEQMRQLDAARGREFDRLFLTGMIQHHNGAVSMVKQLFDTYGAAQDEMVFKFASDVNIDQTTEIARMEKMLTALLLNP